MRSESCFEPEMLLTNCLLTRSPTQPFRDLETEFWMNSQFLSSDHSSVIGVIDPPGLKIKPVKWQMSSFTYQRPTCKGHDTMQQQRLKLYPTHQKHAHHQSIAVDRGQSGNSLQLLIPNNNNSVKGSCNHHYSYYIKQQRKTKRSAAADIHQISLSKQIIISTYNVGSLYQLGKLNQLCCGGARR